VGGDAPLADQIAQLRRQRRRQPRHQAGQGQAEPPPGGGTGAADLTAACVKHGRDTQIEPLLQLLPPAALERGEQHLRLGPIQQPRQLGHRQLQAAATRLLQQRLQLGISEGHVRAHQHQSGQVSAGGIAAPQSCQTGGIERLRRQGHQAVEQAGGRLEQQPPRRRGRGVGHRPHGRPEGRQLLGPLGIDRHHTLIAEGTEASAEGTQAIARTSQARRRRIQLGQADRLHRRSRDPAAALVLHPGGQMAAGVSEQTIGREGSGVHRLAMQQVQARHRGATTGQEGRHQKRGVERAELSGDLIHLQRKVPAQGGITAADNQPALDPARRQGTLQHRPQGAADGGHPRSGLRRRQGAGVGQQKQQRRGVAQASSQARRIPAQQERCAVHRLGSSGIVVDHDDLEPLCHGTIVP